MTKPMRILLALWLFAFSVPPVCAGNDTVPGPGKETRKKGWTWAALPIVAWDADMGLQLGALGQVFDYGDGSTARSTTGGTSWAALGQAQFTPTATSHAYRERGTYPIGVTVQYAASVDFGSGSWRPVAGYVTASSGGYDVQVLEARTALVGKTCLENPGGPGC